MAIAPAYRLKPPFRVCGGEEAYWVEDAAGRRFGFCYFDAKPFAGTGREARLAPAVALAMARQIARLPALLERVPKRKKPPG